MSLWQMLTVHILNFLAFRFIHPVEAVPQFIRHHFLTGGLLILLPPCRRVGMIIYHDISAREEQDGVRFIYAPTFSSKKTSIKFVTKNSDKQSQKMRFEPNVFASQEYL